MVIERSQPGGVVRNSLPKIIFSKGLTFRYLVLEAHVFCESLVGNGLSKKRLGLLLFLN
jgi:hypothetical protein